MNCWRPILNLIWQKFWRLMVIRIHHIKNKIVFRECECDCWNKTIVRRNHLKNGDTKSCGCLHNERMKEIFTTHGMSTTKFRRLFKNMNRRCYEENNCSYKNYGWRWIKILRKSFEEFVNDMYESYLEHKKNHTTISIERIDNNWPYSRENCRWATMKEQDNNKSSNVKITINWETKNLFEWLEIYWMRPETYYYRIKKLWRDSIRAIITKPMNKNMNLTYYHP
jgi:hypothetical protein